jgi:hypothetical protein
MDANNNNVAAEADVANNRFRGRAIPLNERAGPIYECRHCKGFVANPLRHENRCVHRALKPYRCPVCRVGYTDDRRVRAHFLANHNQPLPAHFLNPHFRHRNVGVRHANAAQPQQLPAPQADAAAAVGPPQPIVAPAEAADAAAAEGPPQPPVAPAEAPEVPPPEHQPMVVDVVPQPVVEAQHQPPVEAEPQPQVDAPEVVLPVFEALEGEVVNVPAAAPQQGLGHAVAPPQQLGGGFGGLGLLLSVNLAANLRQAREGLGSDLLVIQLVTQVLGDPELFRL